MVDCRRAVGCVPYSPGVTRRTGHSTLWSFIRRAYAGIHLPPFFIPFFFARQWTSKRAMRPGELIEPRLRSEKNDIPKRGSECDELNWITIRGNEARLIMRHTPEDPSRALMASWKRKRDREGEVGHRVYPILRISQTFKCNSKDIPV